MTTRPVAPVRASALLASALLASALLASALLAACGGGSGDGATRPIEPRAPLTVVALGRAERGDTLTLRALRGGDTLSASLVAWSVSDSAVAAVVAPDRLALKKAGAVTVRAAAGPDAGTTPVTIAAPPRIVFDQVLGGNRDVYVVAIDGGDLVRLTTNGADDVQPTSAAGLVVFTSFRDGNGELYSVPLSGGAERRLTTTSSHESEPALSPDGRRLAFVRDVGGMVGRLFVAAPDGSDVRAATEGTSPAALEAAPAWTPASDRLAFVSTGSRGADLYLVTPPGAGATLGAVNSDGADAEPAWHPDGQRLAFVSDRGGVPAIYLLDTRTQAVVPLVARENAVGQPTWLADGRLVFTAFTAAGSRLVWIDAARPTVLHEIPTGSATARRAAVAR